MATAQKQLNEQSLQHRISTKLQNDQEDYELVDLLNEYSESLRLINQDFIKSLKYSDIAKTISQKLNYESGLAWSLLNIGSCLCYLDFSPEPFENLTKSLSIFRKLKNVKGEAHSLIILGMAKLAVDDYVSANDLIEQGLKLSIITKYQKGECIAYYLLGTLNEKLKNYKAVVKHCKLALSIQDGFELKGRLHTLIGKALLKQSEIKESKKYLQNALEVSTLYQDNFSTSQIFILLGKISLTENNTAQAKDYFTQGIELTKHIGLVDVSVQIINDISESFIKYQDYDFAINLLDYFRNLDNLYNTPERQAIILLNVALVKLKAKKSDDILESLNLTWGLIKDTDKIELKCKCQKAFAEAYESIGDFENAYKHHKLFHKFKSEFNKLKKNKQIKLLEKQIKVENQRELKQLALIKNSHLAQVIYEVHEKENALNKAENAITDLRLETKRFQSLASDCIHCSSIGA